MEGLARFSFNQAGCGAELLSGLASLLSSLLAFWFFSCSFCELPFFFLHWRRLHIQTKKEALAGVVAARRIGIDLVVGAWRRSGVYISYLDIDMR